MKRLLEMTPGVKVFDPNTDNAFITEGDEEEANGKWLKNWRKTLKLARRSKGKVLQILVCEPSPMQDAEADMARSEGVPVLKIDATRFTGKLLDHENFPEEHRQMARDYHAFIARVAQEHISKTLEPTRTSQLKHFEDIEVKP